MAVLYLSTFLGVAVTDVSGRPVGKVNDLIARLGGEYPLVFGLRVRTPGRSNLDVSWSDVRAFESSQVFLNDTVDRLEPYELGDRDVLLARHVMDKQIVDLEDRRLIRVQDIELARVGTRLRVLGVDVSASALLRRLGMWRVADRVTRKRPPAVVPWSDVDLGSWKDPSVRLRVSRSALVRLHPADLAEIAADLPPDEGVELLSHLEAAVAADTLEEMDPEDQARMLEALGPDRAAELFDRMSPDDAADLINFLSRSDGEALLARLPQEEADEIRSLLGFEQESAGGLMTTEFFEVDPTELAGDVIERLRHRSLDEEHAHHIFVVDDGVLVGDLTVYELVIADPRTPVADVMHREPVSVRTDEDQDEVVEAIMKYNLLAVPVVDEADHLRGVITIDDVVDLIRPRGGRGFLR